MSLNTPTNTQTETPTETPTNTPTNTQTGTPDVTPTERNSIAKRYAINCCDEVLGFMGADRGYSFWVEVKQELEKI